MLVTSHEPSQGDVSSDRTEELSVSVIIPTFDRSARLKRALYSVLAQSQPPAEVWVVDDGSGDDTCSVVRTEFPEVQYLYQENQGVSAARNAGLAQATGDWIAFLDSDDEWLPDKLARQVAALAEQSQYRVCHTDELWIRKGRRVNPRRRHAKPTGWVFQHCLPLCALSPSSILIHRSVFEEVGVFDEALPVCEDYDLWLRISSRFPVLLVDEPLLKKYGGHEDQLSRRYWGMDRFRIQALEKAVATLPLSPEDLQAARAMLRQKIEIYLIGLRKRDKVEEIEAYEGKLRALLGVSLATSISTPLSSTDPVDSSIGNPDESRERPPATGGGSS